MQNTISEQEPATISDRGRDVTGFSTSEDAPVPIESKTDISTQPKFAGDRDLEALVPQEPHPPVYGWNSVIKTGGLLKISQSFIGVIDEIDVNIVHARISDKRNDPDFDTFVTFSLDDLMPPDRRIAGPGSIFYAFTGIQKSLSGEKHVNEIRLRRLIRKPRASSKNFE
jgi:hypothetical protein